MSHVDFLDVFDPAGLPVGLSDREAAEQARHRRLSQPSPRLLALLTRIRQQPPGMTVNVLSVEWIDGDPPRVEGEGANCALWTLVLPLDEDFDTEELEDVEPRITHWAEELGLRVIGELVEALEEDERDEAHPKERTPFRPPETGARPVRSPVSSDGVVSIFLNHHIGLSAFSNCQGRTEAELEELGNELMRMERFREGADIRRSLARRDRLILRLLQELPWQTHGSALWVDGDPALRQHQWSGPGFKLRVPENRLDEVMKVLIPLAMQLAAQVLVPSRRFWFTHWTLIKLNAERQLQAWYPAWQTHSMEDDARRAMLIKGLGARLEPLGFEFEEGPGDMFRFTRPLKLGGGYQMVSSGGTGFFLIRLKVTSARMLHMQAQLGRAPASAALRGFEAEGLVIDHDMLNAHTHPFGCLDYEEQATWYFEEFERLALPALEHLQTARAVYEWYWDDKWENGFKDRWLWRSIYAARYLPDAEFFPIVDQFISKYKTDNPNHAFGRFIRAQPQFVGEQV